MQTKRLALSLLVVGLALSCSAAGQDSEKNKVQRQGPPEIGKPAPDFELKGCDGKTYRLSDHKDKIVVLEWINEECPWSQMACPQLKANAEKYADKGVVWLAIDSTHHRTAQMDAEYAKRKNLPYPILMDSAGKVGRLYHAKTTPHMFIINKGTLVYDGAHDNRRGRDYVAESLEAILAGKQVPSSKTRPYGCSVKYAKADRGKKKG